MNFRAIKFISSPDKSPDFPSPYIKKRRLTLFSYLLIFEAVVILFLVGLNFAINSGYTQIFKDQFHPKNFNHTTLEKSLYANLFRNYKILNSFIYLPVNPPIQGDFLYSSTEQERMNPFVRDILRLKSASKAMLEKKTADALAILQSVTPLSSNSKSGPLYRFAFYIQQLKNKIQLKYLFSQKRYGEFTELLENSSLHSRELKLMAITCYIHTNQPDKAFPIFKKLFNHTPFRLFEAAIPSAQLSQFLSRIEPDVWMTKIVSLGEIKQLSGFVPMIGKFVKNPPLSNLLQAESHFILRNYDQCIKNLSAIQLSSKIHSIDSTLGARKQIILVKLDARAKRFEKMETEFAAFKKTYSPSLYNQMLFETALLLFHNNEKEKALDIFQQFIDNHGSSSKDLSKSIFNEPDHNYWKAVWLTAWLYYRNNDKQKAAVYFKRSMDSPNEAYKMGGIYWMGQLGNGARANLADFAFSYYYAQSPEINPVESLKPFIRLMNTPQSDAIRPIIDILKVLISYNLFEEAYSYIQWELAGDNSSNSNLAPLSPGDRNLLKLIESILLQKEEKHNAAYCRYKENFEKHQYIRLPKFLSSIYLPVKFESLIGRYSRLNEIDPALVYSLIKEESFFRPNVKSPADAYGLMQMILPTAQSTARPDRVKLTVADLLKPEINVRYGIRHLKELLEAYNGKLHLVLAAYNAGPHRVETWVNKFGNVSRDEFIELIPFTETRNYVKNILRNMSYYKFYYEKR